MRTRVTTNALPLQSTRPETARDSQQAQAATSVTTSDWAMTGCAMERGNTIAGPTRCSAGGSWGNEWRGSTCTAIHCQDQGEWPCYRPTRAGRGRTPTSHRNGAIGCRPAQSQWTAQANCICATAHLRCVGATVTLGAVVVGGWAAAPCT